MRKLLLVALLLLPLSVAWAPAHANAETAYTADSLTRLMLNDTELNAALKSASIKTTFGKGQDVDPTINDTVIGVGRVWETSDGSFLSVNLLSSVDGSPPAANIRDAVLNGEFAKALAGGAFEKYDFLGVGPSLWGDGNDAQVAMLVTFNGKENKMLADTFIRGNVYGIVYYVTTGDNDGPEVGATFGGQMAKLP